MYFTAISDLIFTVIIYICIFYCISSDSKRLSRGKDIFEETISSIGSVLNPLSIIGHIFTTMFNSFGTCVPDDL